ncbi:hypothetical protein PLICRDRAFT_526507 [Plicaturopsis crispa FD-325 SS-3]|nr:hypothetical protein PLICRDRAFT_526507 [Plicaturopsis crispa FD-325 SS-3]
MKVEHQPSPTANNHVDKRRVDTSPVRADEDSHVDKRPRLTDNAGTRKNALFWPSEDFVVVEVEKERFKLLKTTLELQSSVFAAIFRGEQSDIIKSSGKIDGHALYCITHTVTARDFEMLLLVLSKSDFQWSSRPVPIRLLARILHPAHALQFLCLRDAIIRTLESIWSKDIDTVDTELCFAHDIITVSKECGAPQLFKRAFYELLRSPKFLSFKYDKENHIAAFASLSERDSALKHLLALDIEDSPTVARLDAQTLLQLTEARTELQSAWFDICSSYPPIACPSDARDSEGRKFPHAPCSSLSTKTTVWKTYMLAPDIFKTYINDPILCLKFMPPNGWQKLHGWNICKECNDGINAHLRVKREELWALLDKWRR